MTKPALIRVFFAIDLPEETKKILDDFISTLKKKSKSHAIRWTKSNNLHITLQFLAEIQVEHVAPLIERVRSHMLEKKLNAIPLRLGGLTLFPNPYRPRVIVLDIHPQVELKALATAIGLGIKEVHYDIDPRPFRGHLTLGRIKRTHHVHLDFLADAISPTIEQQFINRVTLFRSEPRPDGSQYTVLDTIAFM